VHVVLIVNQAMIGGYLLKIKYPIIISFVHYGTTHMYLNGSIDI